MRVVVTGSNGQLALSLRECAAAWGIDLLFVGRPEVEFARPHTIGPALRAARAEIIVNAAAYTAVDLAENDEATAMLINAQAAGEIAAHAHAEGVPVIQISTDYVFDGALDRPYLETDAPAPATAYGRTKLAGEVAVANAAKNHAILRTAWVYSPFGKNFVRTMLDLGRKRGLVSVVADQIGNPTYALDIADGVLRSRKRWSFRRATIACAGFSICPARARRVGPISRKRRFWRPRRAAARRSRCGASPARTIRRRRAGR